MAKAAPQTRRLSRRIIIEHWRSLSLLPPATSYKFRGEGEGAAGKTRGGCSKRGAALEGGRRGGGLYMRQLGQAGCGGGGQTALLWIDALSGSAERRKTAAALPAEVSGGAGRFNRSRVRIWLFCASAAAG